MKYSHGGEKYDKKIDIDFSANVNPFGMPQSVIDVLMDKNNIGEFTDYPDFNCTCLRKAIAQKKNVNMDNILCGNGASDLIYRICFALKPKKVLLASPCFSEYEKAVNASGGEVCIYDTKEENGFKIQHDFIGVLEYEKPDMIFLCTPSNPVGVLTESSILLKTAAWSEKNNCHFFIDECFNSFVSVQERFSMVPISIKNRHVHVLDAFTKIYGMAGLRLGFLVSSNSQLLEKASQCGGCWNVSAPAQLAGTEALMCDDYVEKTREYIFNEKELLKKSLSECGYKVYDGSANYILFKSIPELYEYMLDRHILIRQCGNYRGLGNEYYRIAVRKRDENERLISELKKALEEQQWQRL
ncbi:MAG: histidinol-phosphate transaminase [Candidatus Metalachnospira sp.]|nr:histidinol-phosphate transaminase [Candidatus Metalachnospira sp.]